MPCAVIALEQRTSGKKRQSDTRHALEQEGTEIGFKENEIGGTIKPERVVKAPTNKTLTAGCGAVRRRNESLAAQYVNKFVKHIGRRLGFSVLDDIHSVRRASLILLNQKGRDAIRAG